MRNGGAEKEVNGEGAKVIALIAGISSVLAPMGVVVMDMREDLRDVELLRRSEVGKLDEKIGSLQTQLYKAESAVALMENKLIEVETQFKWSTDIGQTRAVYFDRLHRLLWKKTFGEELPAINISDMGPGRNGH